MLNNENRYLFKFAWKSIRRNAGRSFFIGFSVSLAVVIGIWVMAFFEGMNSQIEKAVVKTNIGYFQLQDPLFSKSTDSSHPHEWTTEFEKKLLRPPVKSASPELVLDGNISTPEGAMGLTVLGIDPDLHSRFLPVKKKTLKGEFIGPGDEDSIVIGQELAEVFKFNVGDQLILNYQDVSGELRSEILQIKGIYHYNSKGFEKRFVYVNQRTLQMLYLNQDTQKILFNRVAIMTPDLSAEKELRSRIAGEDLELKTWKNLNPEMAVVMEFHDGMIKFFFLIIGVTILMTILTPVRMLWQERFKELKMMSVIGVGVKKFWKIGFFEIIQMIMLSFSLSLILLISVVGTQSKTGIDFRFLNDGVAIERAGIKLPGIIYPLLTWEQLVITFFFVILVLAVSYLWSIHRTLRKLEGEI